MAGNVDFRNDLNAPLPGIGHQGANLLLGVVAAVVLRLGDPPEVGGPPPAPHLGEQGIFPDFHPPTLVVGEMPVHGVHPAQSRSIQKPANILRRYEVTADIQHKAIVGKRHGDFSFSRSSFVGKFPHQPDYTYPHPQLQGPKHPPPPPYPHLPKNITKNQPQTIG